MDEIKAAGGVLWRPATAAGALPPVEIALIHRPRYNDWSLPKGKLDPGESFLDAAVREVREETGHRGRVGAPLGAVHYQKGARTGGLRGKVVHYWAMEATEGDFRPGDEVDALEWVTPDEATRRVSYELDREIIRRFLESLASA